MDGVPPPRDISDKFIALVKTVLARKKDECIAIHCVAGLGRAPVMVAVALMEIGKMPPEDAVEAIRRKRAHALNSK